MFRPEKVVMSDAEGKVVEAAIGLVARTRGWYAPLMPMQAETPPIPFFGRLGRARIVTLGLNPSTRELAGSRRWPPRLDAEGLTCRLAAYFESDDPPPMDWFAPWATAVSSVGSSYTVDAAHGRSPLGDGSRVGTRPEVRSGGRVSDELSLHQRIHHEGTRRGRRMALRRLAAQAGPRAGGVPCPITPERPGTPLLLLHDWPVRRQRGPAAVGAHASQIRSWLAR